MALINGADIILKELFHKLFMIAEEKGAYAYSCLVFMRMEVLILGILDLVTLSMI